MSNAWPNISGLICPLREHESMTWDQLDWAALDRLRDRFLTGSDAPAELSGSYWNCGYDLANYDFTFAQRIGWKWDAVLGELRQRDWRAPTGPVLDWGCGSGIAGRRVVEFLEPERPVCLRVFDHSPLAMEFAAFAARRQFPTLHVETASRAALEECSGTLVISHVLNELDETARRLLRQSIDRAQAVLWVEPGTFADSRALIAIRESLRETFEFIAPCPHQASCGLRAPGNERHWCHHFAAPPPGIMADSNWVRFAQRAGIDLRTLPYSYLVMEKKGQPVPSHPRLTDAAGWARILGEPRVYKGFAKLLSCQAAGVSEFELQKRVDPTAFKAFKEGHAPSLWRYKVEGQRIVELLK
jgi:hypothetical protein